MLTDMDKIVGTWKIDDSDPAFSGEYISLIFEKNGNHIYTIHTDDGLLQKILLVYELRNGILYTDQPSHPRIEETRYWFDGDDLVLEYGAKRARFKRVPDGTPITWPTRGAKGGTPGSRMDQ